MGTRGHQAQDRGFVPSRSVPRRGRAGQGVLEQGGGSWPAPPLGIHPLRVQSFRKSILRVTSSSEWVFLYFIV